MPKLNKNKSLFEDLQVQSDLDQDLNLDDSNNDNLKEDFLQVDKEIPNQKFVCLSFVSPENILKEKENYYFHSFLLEEREKAKELVEKEINKILEKSLSGTVDSSELVSLKKTLNQKLPDDEQSLDNFTEKYLDFKYVNQDQIESQFHEEKNYQTTVRGLKVRGVYATKYEADIRAKVLQRLDPSFHIFIGQVGYWLPWDPQGDKIEKQEYLNEDLNKLVSEYKTNEEKKNIFFEEQVQAKKEEAMERRKKQRAEREKQLRQKKEEGEQNQEGETTTTTEGETTTTTEGETTTTSEGETTVVNQYVESDQSHPLDDVVNQLESSEKDDDQVNRTSLSLGDETQKEVSMKDTVDQLSQMDPWMKRKLEEKDSQEN